MKELPSLAGVYRATVEGRILECNETFARIYGYGSPAELESLDDEELYLSREERQAFLDELRRKGVLLNHELRGRRKDGAAIWLLENAMLCPASGDEPEVIQGTLLDINERKDIEEKLRASGERLRRMSQQFQTAREDERTRVAREIHDELGQRLTALKMSVSRLRKGLAPEAAVLRSESRAILESIDELLHTVRDLSTQLRPAVLDHLDLDDAVKWQARDFESKTGIRCEVISRLDGLPLGSRRTTDLFRVVQEALTNVVRHAKASRVQIQILREAGDLLLEVADNGQGTSDEDLNRPASLGLLGIRERIEALGGDVQLVSAPGKGTRIRVRVPLRRRETGHEEDSDRR